MELIRPFRGLRPLPQWAAQVVAPPYDVLSSAEARVLVAGNPLSFLHLSKPEVDFADGMAADAPAVYARARGNLQRLLDDGILVRDRVPCYYVYRLATASHTLTGLVVAASVAAYEDGRICRHELTRAAKEDDRTRMIETLGAQTGPVMLAWRANAALGALLDQASQGTPDLDCQGPDGVRHTLWAISDPGAVAAISAAAATIPRAYIADGHHRAAAAARVARARREAAPAAAPAATQPSDDLDPGQFFLAVVFAHTELRILDYNRLVTDLNGLTAQAFLERVAQGCRVEPSAQRARPQAPACFGLYLPGQWYHLSVAPERIPASDPIARLDVSLLSDTILEPILGIRDARVDARIDFVGGARGLAELEQRVDSGEMAAAFALFPTRMEDVMAVSDAGAIMPPKSTWFEPKLADGLVSSLIDKRFGI